MNVNIVGGNFNLGFFETVFFIYLSFGYFTKIEKPTRVSVNYKTNNKNRTHYLTNSHV